MYLIKEKGVPALSSANTRCMSPCHPRGVCVIKFASRFRLHHHRRCRMCHQIMTTGRSINDHLRRLRLRGVVVSAYAALLSYCRCLPLR